jgi:rhodanese-related sulfurtransferase
MDAPIERIFAAAHERAQKDLLPYFGALSPSDAYAVIKAVPNARLIDVRTRPEWDYVGHVPESSLLEWNAYPDGRRNPEFLPELRVKAPDPEAPVFFLCRSGQRSDGAARVAAAAGYSKAFNVLEGFEGDKDARGQRGKLGGWRKAGLPWVQG